MQQQVSQPQRIYAFGSLQIFVDGDIVLLKGEKSRSLAAYLILNPRTLHRREMLANMLWPDAPPERVRRNLSDMVYRLQKVVKSNWLAIDDESITFQPNQDLWVDVWEFDNLISSKDPDDLQKAVDLYTGDLLPEIYDEWILAERELRRSQYLSALEIIASNYEIQGNLQQALICARKLILTEPLHEPAHQIYLRLLGRLRRFGEALAHYDYFSALLRSELDTNPGVETEGVIKALLRERDLEASPIVMEEQSPFIGRKAERAAALSVVETMLKGSGGLLTIEGEAGIGKSRLLNEIAAGARWRGAAVLNGQASEAPSESPFVPFIEALTPIFNSPRGKQLEALLPIEMRTALAPLNPAWGGLAGPHLMPTEQAGKYFNSAMRLLGESLASMAPVVLMLDDMHWASPVLWECLRAFASAFARHGGLLVMTYRRVDIEQLPGWEIVKSWDRDGILTTISLEPFSVDDVAQLVGETSNLDPAEIRAWSGGNPFFINEWLAEPELKRPTNESAISLRLQSLSPLAKSALQKASILGESVPYRLWTEISELPPIMLASLGDELVAHQWLQPSEAGYIFIHNLIRSSVYTEIEPATRRLYHERAAHAYLTFEPDNLRARAYHLDQAGLSADAARVFKQAGEQDLTRFAFLEAQRAFERALTLMPDSTSIERVEIALALAHVSNTTGDRVRQESALNEALAGAGGSEPHLLRALLIFGQFAAQTGQISESKRRLDSALELARKLNDRARETEAILLLAQLAREQSHWNEAQKYYDQSLELARANSDPAHQARALTGIGYIFSEQGLPYDSISWIDQAINVYRAIGDFWRMAITQAGLMSSLIEICAWNKALTMADEAIPVLESYGDRPNVAVARHNQALAFQALGDLVQARQILELNLKVFEEIRSRRALGVTELVLGNISENEGKDDEALSFYRLALANSESVNSLDGTASAQWNMGALLVNKEQPLDAIPLLEAALALWIEQENVWERNHTEAVLGLALLMIGDRARAEELAASGWKFFQAKNQMGEKPQKWLWALYRLQIALNQSEQAQEILRAAYDELQRQAKNISDQAQRRGFFEQVPENQAIVNAYDQLLGGPRVISVSLARKDVPLGRTLRSDEFVPVIWTLNSAEDESISDKSERRHRRLARLLEEAEKQNAAPTDDDLAQALGVSRRTILRDMQVLDEHAKPKTRKRKK